ncbi:MAG TPA: hypothetical protein EYP86_05395 [Candidatus Altiarchaeales archaeon]|nr:hypothetical protein [Candidatus Altiarchaeales archaeon]
MRAKSMLLKLILSMILVSVSLDIFAIILGISDAMSEGILAGLHIDATYVVGLMGIGSSFLITTLSLALYLLIAFIVICLRHIFVLVMAALFPFTLFLYFFDFTKSVGFKLLKYSLTVIFTQVVMALILAITIIGVNSMDTSTLEGKIAQVFLLGSGLTLIIIAPLIMTGIMQWFGALLASVGMIISLFPGLEAVGTALTFAGSLMAGMGSTSFIIAGATMGFASSWGRVMGATRLGVGAGRTKRLTYKQKRDIKRVRKEIEGQRGQPLPRPRGIREKIRATRKRMGRAKPWIVSPGYQLYKRGYFGRIGRLIGKKISKTRVGRGISYVGRRSSTSRPGVFIGRVARRGIGLAGYATRHVIKRGIVGSGVGLVKRVGKPLTGYGRIQRIIRSKPAKWIRGTVGKGIGFAEKLERAHIEEIREMAEKPMELISNVAIPGRFGYKVFSRTGLGRSVTGKAKKVAMGTVMEMRGVTIKGMLKKAVKEGILLSIPVYNVVRVGRAFGRFLRAGNISNSLRYVSDVKQGKIGFNAGELKAVLINSGISQNAISSLGSITGKGQIKKAEEMLAQQWHANIYNYEKEMAKAWKSPIYMNRIEKMRREMIDKLPPYQAQRDIYKLRKLGVSDDTIRMLGYKI